MQSTVNSSANAADGASSRATPMWMRPWVAFVAVFFAVSLLGSLLLIGIWIAGGTDAGEVQAPVASIPSPPPQPAAAPPLTLARGVGTFSIDDFPATELPADADGFAFDSTHEHLAVIGAWRERVAIVAADDLARGGAAEPKTIIRLPGIATAIAHKPLATGNVFAVGHALPDGVTLIDAASLETIQTIRLEQGHPRHLAAPTNAAAKYLYVALGQGQAPYTKQLGLARIDLDRGEVAAHWEEQVFRDVAVSPSGEFIYARPTNSDRDLHRARPEADGAWQDESSRVGKVTRPYVTDARGLYVAAGTNLYTADIARHVMELEFDPLAFWSDKPWLAGLREDELVVGSINDGRVLAAVPLPPEWLVPDEKIRQRSTGSLGPTTIHPAALAQVLADEQHDRFLLCTRRHVIVLPLSELRLPQEPMLVLAEAPSTAAQVGRSYSASIKTVSGSPRAELVEAPRGMSIEGEQLRWTPAPDQVGEANVNLRLTDGEVAHEDVWPVHVRQNTLTLPFLVLGCDPSTDGKAILVWGHEWPGEERSVHHWRDYQPPAESRVAIVDAASQSVLAERTINAAVRQGELNATGAYLATSEGYARGEMEVQRLSAATLAPLGKATIASGKIASVADRFLVSQRESDRLVAAYRLPDFQLFETSERRPHEPPATVGKVADGWIFAGALWDHALRKPKLVLVAPRLRAAARSSRTPTSRIAVEEVLQGYVLHRVKGSGPALVGWQPDRARYTPDVPAQLNFRRKMDVCLEFSDLTTQALVSRVVLHQSSGRTRYPYDYEQVQIATVPGRLFATHMGQTYVIPTGEMELKPPFRITPEQSTIVLPTSEPIRVQYHAPGATKFELHIPGLDDDSGPFLKESSDGAFEIDLREAARDFAKVLTQEADTRRGRERGRGSWAQTYVEESRDHVRRLTGKAPVGAPLFLEAYVRAYNNDLQVAVLRHGYLVEVPLDRLRAGTNKSTPRPPTN